MAEFKNIMSSEVVTKPTKQEALEYFREKDKSTTRFHIKSVVVASYENLIEDTSLENEGQTYTNKTEDNGKRQKGKQNKAKG